MNLFKVGVVFAVPTLAKLIAGLVIMKLIVIYLGVDGLGRLSQYMTFITILSIIAGGGVSVGIVKFVAEFKEQRETFFEYVQVASFVTFAFSIAFAVVIFCFSENISSVLFKTDFYVNQIKLLAFIQAFIGVSSLLLGVMNGVRDVKGYCLVTVASVVAGSLGVLFGCAWYGLVGTMYGMMWFSSCQLIFLIIWFHYFFKESWLLFRPKWSRPIVLRYANFSVMQLVSVLTIQITQIIVRGLVESNGGWGDVGYWQGLIKISDAYIMFVSVVLANYYMPRLSEAKSKIEVKSVIMQAYFVVVPVLLVLIFGIYIFKDIILIILYSKDFLVLSDLFVWQLVGDFFRVMSYILAYLCVAKAATKIYVAAEVIQSSIFLLLSACLISRYGMPGAIYAYASTYIAYFIICSISFRKYLAC